MSNEVCTLRFFADAGHGWYGIKRHWLADLGIADRVSEYSYQRGDTVYLEEDCDAALAVEALKARGVKVTVLEMKHQERSPIRSYDRYSKNAIVGLQRSLREMFTP